MAVKRARLSADDWIAVATKALGEGGLSAVAVEPLAVRLGATKGSFYAHFPHREALLTAVLREWELRATEAKLFALDVEPDPVTRLRTLLVHAAEGAGHDQVEISLWAVADHPLVSPVLRRVMQRRIAYLTGLFEQLGFGNSEAIQRATLCYTAYLGHCEFVARLPETLPIVRAGGLTGYIESVLRLLLQDRPEARS
ncbi:TetR/AcrR family transcriptional regulator [Nonomuraea sp. NPDC049152]|uniref:TetR/AcrR family transcriptional regulator n=1 Tax=Nonomuraea sp. NPDC049152 TaxID=3154350 RepID=UPI0033FF22F5